MTSLNHNLFQNSDLRILFQTQTQQTFLEKDFFIKLIPVGLWAISLTFVKVKLPIRETFIQIRESKLYIWTSDHWDWLTLHLYREVGQIIVAIIRQVVTVKA